jgi:hypothetical protein
LQLTNPEFRGGLVDYRKVVAQSVGRTRPDYRWYRGIVPSWDNTARRQHTSHILVDSSPGLYGFWLKWLVRYTRANNAPEDQLIFINAWNEWGEGCHLEPDLKHGLAYLEATYAAVSNQDAQLDAILADSQLLREIGGERIARFMDEKDRLAQDVILLSAELRHRTANPAEPRRSWLRRVVAALTRPFPRLHRFGVRMYLAWRG